MISSNWKTTRNHQTNLSTAKAAYAFPRDTRFKENHTPTCQSFYNLASTLSPHTTGIGKGNKVSMVNPNAFTPSPLQYHIPDRSFSKSKGPSFGVSRDKAKDSGIFCKSQTPQPGKYSIPNTLTKQGFSLYPKLSLPSLSNQKNPGPGHYNSSSALNTNGKYILSQMRDCPGYKLKNSKSRQHQVSTPGPGHYSNGDQMNSVGRYSNSRLVSSRCRSFSRSERSMDVVKKNPGPGAYDKHSEFGCKK